MLAMIVVKTDGAVSRIYFFQLKKKREYYSILHKGSSGPLHKQVEEYEHVESVH